MVISVESVAGTKTNSATKTVLCILVEWPWRANAMKHEDCEAISDHVTISNHSVFIYVSILSDSLSSCTLPSLCTDCFTSATSVAYSCYCILNSGMHYNTIPWNHVFTYSLQQREWLKNKPLILVISIWIYRYIHTTYGVQQLNCYCHGNSFLPSLLKSAGSLRGSV